MKRKYRPFDRHQNRSRNPKRRKRYGNYVMPKDMDLDMMDIDERENYEKPSGNFYPSDPKELKKALEGKIVDADFYNDFGDDFDDDDVS